MSSIVPVPTSPIVAESAPDADIMRLTGTLLRRGADFALEEQLGKAPSGRDRWTTPRLYLLESTAATRDAADAAVGQVVSITGTPSRSGRRLGSAIVLDSITLTERGSTAG